MGSIIKDTAAGFFIRYVTKNKFLKYPEELPGFKFPYVVDDTARNRIEKETQISPTPLSATSDSSSETTDVERNQADAALQNLTTSVFNDGDEGIILVGWYSSDDPANPQNWSSGSKVFSCGLICFLTFTIYLGSSAYAPAIPSVIEIFGVSEAVAALGLSLYVIGYGLGPLVFSPLSEVALLGRNSIYICTFLMYILMTIPTALTNNIPAFMVARFLAAFFGSPALATSPASFTDMLPFTKIPYVLAMWSSAATLAPALGPITVGYALQVKDWHWSMLELLWLASPAFVMFFFFLPETSSANILYRRAARLRLLTGNPNFKSASELKQTNSSLKKILFNALIKPWEMNILDPAILFSTVYVALCYAVFYSFFIAFPLVFVGKNHFGLGASGLPYLTVPIGLVVAIPLQLSHYYFYVEPSFAKNGPPAPEFWLKPAMTVTVFAPIGLFIFAWTSSLSVHWVVPLIGVVLFQATCYQVINSLFAYIASIYPTYAASLFAANAAARSALAGGAIMFSSPMFKAIGVGPGVSVLASVTAVCSGLLFVLYFAGPALRKKSRFVVE